MPLGGAQRRPTRWREFLTIPHESESFETHVVWIHLYVVEGRPSDEHENTPMNQKRSIVPALTVMAFGPPAVEALPPTVVRTPA